VQQQPTLTIVTPSYNTGAFIEQTLASVVEQDYPGVEHIVLDSESTDETPEILARFPEITLIRPAPSTMPEKVKRGFELASGELIGWINADDYYLPGAFRKAAAAFAEHDVGMVYCNALDVDMRGEIRERRKAAPFDLNRLLNVNNYISHPTVFFRAEAVRDVGGIDTRWPNVLDLDLFIRVGRAHGAAYVDDYWAAFRVYPGQGSDVHKDTIWFENRKMLRHHGARLITPHAAKHYSKKAGRAGQMLRNRDLRGFAGKLVKNTRLVLRYSLRRR